MILGNFVSRLKQRKDVAYYKCSCECMDPRCDVIFALEHDEQYNDITLVFYNDFIYDSGCEYKLYKKIWKRICGSLRLLFIGRVQTSHSVIIAGPEHIQSLIDALNEGIEKLGDTDGNQND